MCVHHRQQLLNVLTLLLRSGILVQVELCNLLASDLHQDLIGFFQLERLSYSAF